MVGPLRGEKGNQRETRRKRVSSLGDLALAYIKGVAEIDAVDRHIASYEMRKMLILREIERRNERLSRQLGKASSEILDAEFSEAAE